MPQAWTLMRTCAAPGSGVSRSTISKGPLGLETWTKRLVIIIFMTIVRFCLNWFYDKQLQNIVSHIKRCKQLKLLIVEMKARFTSLYGLSILTMNHKLI